MRLAHPTRLATLPDEVVAYAMTHSDGRTMARAASACSLWRTLAAQAACARLLAVCPESLWAHASCPCWARALATASWRAPS